MHPLRPRLQDYTENNLLENYVNNLAAHLHSYPYDIDALIDLMFINAKLNRKEEYMSLSSKALGLDPNNCYANRIRGRFSLLIECDPEKASNFLMLAAQQNPREPAWVQYYSGIRSNYYERVFPGLLYTPIGKNGSTTIKYIYAQRSGLGDELIDPHLAFTNPFFEFTKIEQVEADTCIKLAITRDPLSRLTSYCQKNVLIESSLCQEVNSYQTDKIYGLPLKPALDDLAANLLRYMFCFDDAMAHLLPQSVNMPNPEHYDIIGDIFALGDAISLVDEKLGLNEKTSVPRLMESSSLHLAPSQTTKDIVTDFYKADYDMLDRLLDDHRFVTI